MSAPALVVGPAATSATAASERRIDLATMAGMAAVVYVVSTVLHEAGGHGLACLAVGGSTVKRV